jgi:hypothetical protein
VPTFTAGQPLAAFETRRALPILALVRSDISVVSTDLVVDAPGLALPLAEFGRYAIDGYVAYTSASTASDLKLGLSVPLYSTGHWSAVALTDSVSTGIGDIEWLRRALTGGSGSLSEAGCAGNAAAAVPIHAYVATGTFGGPLSVQFAQIVPSATPLTIVAGSWLRATLID